MGKRQSDIRQQATPSAAALDDVPADMTEDPSPSWTLEDATPQDAQVILAILREVERRSAGRIRQLTRREARLAAVYHATGLDHWAAYVAAREYLTRVKKDPNAPRDLRVVFTDDAQIGGFSTEALKCCLDAGFEKIRFTGYIPFGGGARGIPQLKPGPDGEAEGYKRYKGELVDTKKLLTDYAEALRRS